MTNSLHHAVTVDYYQTTAGRSHTATRDYYETCANGLLRWLRDWLPADKNARCLDLACGCGEMQYLLEREGYSNTTGVDLCQEELQQAGRFVKGELVNDDILTFLQARPSSSVDFISALNILEHLPKDQLQEVLKEAQRVLHPGGTLVAIVPNAVSPFGSLTRHWDITHEWAFTTNNFRQLAALAEFDQDVQFREARPVAHGIISLIRSILWQFLRLGIALRFLIEVGTVKDGIYTMDMLVRLRAQGDERVSSMKSQ
ncbi:MAG: class I SAM-dependent methyltransferase [Pyrinomonadaceae bacterium]|nr:class I SAM-dependent methyltransferase [Pyrinomonadaceae bacterium]